MDREQAAALSPDTVLNMYHTLGRYEDEIADLRAKLESIALVTAYTEPLPGSLVGHVKILMSNLLDSEAKLDEAGRAMEQYQDEIAQMSAKLEQRSAREKVWTVAMEEMQKAQAHVQQLTTKLEQAQDLLRAETDQKWKEYHRALDLSARVQRLEAALREIKSVCYRDRHMGEPLIQFYKAAEAALNPPTHDPQTS